RRQDEEPLTPNINVVLRNLPDKAREVDIQNQLTTMSASVEDVSLIKDRETGESKKFAFVRFTSVGHAIQFVEKYKRFEMDSYFVRVDYCKKGHQRDTAEEWRCNICGKFNPGSRRLCFECKRSYQSKARFFLFAVLMLCRLHLFVRCLHSTHVFR
ncbi:hypothetical protein BDF20DRAFT_824396, partial [Mycotypha africana]|uniref:uncharacterized protein n=1 Tax=Mycotypha africana TaxID=64632 RepID=UPI002300862C